MGLRTTTAATILAVGVCLALSSTVSPALAQQGNVKGAKSDWQRKARQHDQNKSWTRRNYQHLGYTPSGPHTGFGPSYFDHRQNRANRIPTPSAQSVYKRVPSKRRQNVDYRYVDGVYFTKKGNRWVPAAAPIETTLPKPPRNSIQVRGDGRIYFYSSGNYYVRGQGGFQVVAPPPGLVVPSLPPSTQRVNVAGKTHGYANGVFYLPGEGGYEVVKAPIGAVVSIVPLERERVNLEGDSYVKYNGVVYRPFLRDGRPAFLVVG